MSDDLVGYLASNPLFGHFDAAALGRLAEAMTPRHVRAGETLVAEGEAADSLFLITGGRLRAYVTDDFGVERVVGELGAKEIVGEMALLSSAPRAATVRAIRDTRLLELSSEVFTRLVLEHPETLLEVTRTLVTRLERSIHAREVGASVHVIAAVAAGASAVHGAIALGIADQLRSAGSVEVVDRGRVEAKWGPGSPDVIPGERGEAEVTEWLHRVETESDRVMLIADLDDTNWTRRCLREADRILLIGRAGDRPALNSAEQYLTEAHTGSQRAGVDLVLVQPENIAVSSGTPAWTAPRRPDRVHHIGRGTTRGIERLARALTNTSTGLVLSGGGARGFAHIGVIRAIEEAGIPIDHVGGASFGAVVAGGLGLGLPVPIIIEHMRAVTVDQGSMIDFTPPAVAIARGARATGGIRKHFADVQIEDLWIDFFCVSSDLTAGRLRVHDSGPVWRAIRASISIPGIFPPVRDHDGHVLADGGVMNNMPADVMRERLGDGTLFAVDLRAGIDLPAADLSEGGIASGWQVLGRRLNPWATSMDVPGIMDILLRSTEIASGEQGHDADVLFRPPVEKFGLLDFKVFEDIIDAGYRHAVDVLEKASLTVP